MHDKAWDVKWPRKKIRRFLVVPPQAIPARGFRGRPATQVVGIAEIYDDLRIGGHGYVVHGPRILCYGPWRNQGACVARDGNRPDGRRQAFRVGRVRR